jgi:hypothetical protein
MDPSESSSRALTRRYRTLTAAYKRMLLVGERATLRVRPAIWNTHMEHNR